MLIDGPSSLDLSTMSKAIPISGTMSTALNYLFKLNRIPLADLLKAHRAYNLYYTHNLVNTELSSAHLQETFEDQIFCSCGSPACLPLKNLVLICLYSENVFTAQTLVLFMHDM